MPEYLFPVALAIVIVVVGSFPYLYGYAIEKPGTQFMGLVGRGVPGGNSYFMFAKQAQEGYHLFENRCTPEPLPRVYFNPEWWLFGNMARWTGLSLVAVFHLTRVFAVFSLLLSLYFLLSLCLTTLFQRRLALLLIVFGSGFGWTLWSAQMAYGHLLFPFLVKMAGAHAAMVPLPRPAPERLLRDLNGVSVLGYLVNKPHFMYALAFAVLNYAFLVLADKSRQLRHYFLSGLCAAIHLIIRPYALVEIALVYLLFPIFSSLRERRVEKTRLKGFLITGGMLVPPVLYYLYLAYTQCLGMGGWKRPTGYMFEHFMWYGVPFVLMFFYFVGLGHFRRVRPAHLVVLLWVTVAFLIAQAYPYISFGEESAIFAFFVVPSILAVADPLRRLYRALLRGRSGHWLARRGIPPEKTRMAAAALLVLLCSISAMGAYAKMFTGLTNHSQEYYLSDNLHKAMLWLDANSAPNDVVLADMKTCVYVPRFTRNKAFTGQDMITNNYERKNEEMSRFFGERGGDDFKRNTVREYHVRYVICGPNEVRPGGMDPREHPWLTMVYGCGDVTVFEARP